MDAKKTALAAVSAGILVRIVFWLTTPVTGDACFHYSIARYISETLSIPTFEYVTGVDPLWWPPLFHITTALLYRITGVLTLTPLLYGAAGLVVFHLFCRGSYPKVALTATLILAFLPFHVYYSSIGYFETLLFLLAVTAFHFYFRFLEEGQSRNLAYAVIASGLSALTHYHGLTPLVAISVHLFQRDRRKAVVFLVAGLLLASPWYARNYVVFGNPFWPKIYGGKFPDDRAVQKTPLSEIIGGLTSVSRWGGAFFDFWIGAPNSGEDFWENVEVGGGRYPFFTILMCFWLLFISTLSLLTIRGFLLMRGKGVISFPILVFTVSLMPFMINGLARMFVSFIPFVIIAMAEGFEAVDFRHKHVVLAVAFLFLMGASYGYSYTYKDILSGDLQFLEEIKSKTTEDARIVMPQPQYCLYYSGRHCMRVGSGGLPYFAREDFTKVLLDYNVDYICCQELHRGLFTGWENITCAYFENETADIGATDSGRCWSVKRLVTEGKI